MNTITPGTPKTKKPITSRTNWMGLVAALPSIAPLLQMLGYDVTPEFLKDLGEQVVTIVNGAIAIVGMIGVWRYRRKATTQVRWTSE